MALNIKNSEVEKLAAEVAKMTGETKTEAVLKALQERKERLDPAKERKQRLDRVRKWLEEEVWPKVPPAIRGKGISKQEQEEIFGIGPEGYCV